MAISYFPDLRKDLKVDASGGHSPIFVREMKIGGDTILLSDHGSWVSLSGKEYDLYKSGRVETSPELFGILARKGIILTDDNKQAVTDAYRNRKRFLYQGTSLHIIVPTLRCNHRCAYCHSSAVPMEKKGFDMDEETAEKVVDFIFQTPSKSVTIEFQGGEPLLRYPLIQHIVDYAKKSNKAAKKNLKFAIVSNLTRMDDDIAKYLIGNDIGICTSLDGPKSIHDANRKLNGGSSYEKVVYWIDRLRNHYKFRYFNALTVVTKNTIPHWKEVVDEYVKWGFEYIWVKWVNNLGYAKGAWDGIGYPPEDFVSFWKNTIDYIVKSRLKIRDVLATYMLKKVLTMQDPMYLDLMSPCGAAIGQLAYDQNGDIFTCDEARMHEIFRLGNVRKDSYKEVLTSPKVCAMMAASTNDTLLCDACSWKPYCGVCPVCNYATQGNLIPKLPADFRCRILKGQFSYIFNRLLSSESHRKQFKQWASKRMY